MSADKRVAFAARENRDCRAFPGPMLSDDRRTIVSDMSPAGPWGAPPHLKPINPPPRRRPISAAGNRRRLLVGCSSLLLMVLGFGIRAYRDLSRPEAWAYWKELYFSPSMTSPLIANADLDGSGRGRPALAIGGTIGAAAASWFRDRLDEAHLAAGDMVVMSSPGGDLESGHDHGRNHSIARPDDRRRRRRCGGPHQAFLLRQRLRARVCRRQDPLSASRARRWGSIGS